MDPQTPIEELEVSVATSDFLDQLGVETLADLIALPEIRAPRFVILELQVLFSDADLPFAGELVVETPQLLVASGELPERWRTIVSWLDEHHPQVLEGFRAPAEPQAIAAVEQALGMTLPSDYKQFLLLHDGQEPGAPMVETCTLSPVASLPNERTALQQLFSGAGGVDPEGVGNGVQPVAYAEGWLPIGRSARGRDVLCIDLDPAEGGRRGQIILLSVDFDERPLVAPSFTELLSKLFEQLQTGELELED